MKKGDSLKPPGKSALKRQSQQSRQTSNGNGGDPVRSRRKGVGTGAGLGMGSVSLLKVGDGQPASTRLRSKTQKLLQSNERNDLASTVLRIATDGHGLLAHNRDPAQYNDGRPAKYDAGVVPTVTIQRVAFQPAATMPRRDAIRDDGDGSDSAGSSCCSSVRGSYASCASAPSMKESRSLAASYSPMVVGTRMPTSADCLNVINPDLVLQPSSGMCRVADSVEFALETMPLWQLVALMVAFFAMPAISFVLDIGEFVPEEGEIACEWHSATRLLLWIALLLTALVFFIVNYRRQGLSAMKAEQIYLICALLILAIKQRVWKTNYMAVAQNKCTSAFSVAAANSWQWPGFTYAVPDINVLQAVTLSVHLGFLEVLALKQRGFPSLQAHVVALTVVFSERAFLFAMKLASRQADDSELFKNPQTHWCDTLRLLFLLHKTYVAFMSLANMSYLRSRSRQLGFWLLTGPAIWEHLLRLLGPEFLRVYFLYKEKEMGSQSYLGQVLLHEFKILALALLYLAPSADAQERCNYGRPRWVRHERSHDLSIHMESDSLRHQPHRLRTRRGNMVPYANEVKAVAHMLRPTFCLETACWAFNCSYLVYFDEPPKKGEAMKPGAMCASSLEYAQLKVRKFFTCGIGGAQGCLFSDLHDPARLFMAFRGTSSLTHAVTDVKSWCEEVQIGHNDEERFWVHSGFYSAYRTVGVLARHALQEYIACLPDASVVSLTFCGHSLGGALAALMAVDNVDWLKSLRVTNLKVYTFGSPRIGDAKFAKYAHSKLPNIYRIRNNVDPVPRWPDPWTSFFVMLLGGRCFLRLLSLVTENMKDILIFYARVGHEVVIMKNSVGDLILDPLPSERLLYLQGQVDVTAHLLPTYRSGLLAAVWQLQCEDNASLLWPPDMESE
eukprot:TRINITY_DN13144_c0_g1_i1.p1 TRINITY_DN13144_c0_g1~~TRINITY_DN13144_c0_g1_i1.p1  ORF type:complete len:898 (+),score=172.31 TRINITY_DN13144_c0_g1_i1:162-2855(+)